MDTKQDAVRLGCFDENPRGARPRDRPARLLCRVPILDPASSSACCTATTSVCGRNPIAFAKLRDLLMLHFAIRKKSAEELGEAQIERSRAT